MMDRRATWLLASLAPALAACPGQFEGEPPTLSGFDEPVAIAAHPDGCTVYVANGNFDSRARGGSVVAVDVATRKALPGRGVEIGSLAAQLRIHENGAAGYVSVRGDDSVTWFSIDADDHGLSCGGGRCGRLRARTLPGSSRENLSEPLAIELVEQDGEVRGILTTWMRDGEVTLHELVPATGKPKDPEADWHLSARWREDQRHIVRGASGLLPLPGGRFAYVTSLYDDALTRFDVRQEDGRWVLETLAEPRVLGSTHDSRSTQLRAIASNQQGDRLFVIGRNPTMRRGTATNLFVVDLVETSTGGVTHSTSAVIPLEGRPGAIRYLPRPDGPDLLYVVMFATDRVVAVDTERLEVVDVVDLQSGVLMEDLSDGQGRSPFDLAFALPDAGAACAGEDPAAPRMEAWITEFGANRVAIVDVQPASPTYHTVVARIGGGGE